MNYKLNLLIEVRNEDDDHGLGFCVINLLGCTCGINVNIETVKMDCYGFYGSFDIYAAKYKAIYMHGNNNL